MKMQIGAALLALATSTTSFAQPTAPARATSAATYKLTRAQLQVLADTVYARLLVVVDQADLEVTPEHQPILKEAIFNGLDHFLSRTDLLSLNEADQQSKLVADTLQATLTAWAAAAPESVVTNRGAEIAARLGSSFGPSGSYSAGVEAGAGMLADVEATIAFGTVSEVVAIGGGMAAAAVAGYAIGGVIDGLITKNNDGKSLGEIVADGMEKADQEDLDKLVEAVKEDAKLRAEYEAEQKRKEEEQKKAESEGSSSNEGSSDESAPPAEGSSTGSSGGTPNPDAETSGSLWEATGGAMGTTPEKPRDDEGTKDPVDVDADGVPLDPLTGEPLPVTPPDDGYTDGQEKPRPRTNLLREDLISIMTHGKLPLIIFSPEMLEKFRAPFIEVRHAVR